VCFDDAESAYAFACEWSARWQERLSEAELAALDDYRGVDYSELNERLRGARPGPGHFNSESYPARLALLDGALAKAPQLERPLVLWRGLAEMAEWHTEGAALRGSLLDDPAYSSCSLWSEGAELFTSSASDDESGVLFRIELPAGTPLAVFDPGTPEQLQDTGYERELECLLPRGLRLQVSAVSTVPGRRYRRAHYLQLACAPA
jgi:hypothetical protein